jgi:hypothetical protein
MRVCYACGVALPEKLEVHRATECPSCRRDLRVCKNCAFYSPGSHWDCAETVQECVLDKERANFCDYFRFRVSMKGGGEPGSGASKGDESRRKLDKLFGA